MKICPMITCTFKLNSQPMSEFVVGGLKYPAYSGHGEYVNKPNRVCTEKGAIPPGEYFILDRESGGRLGWFWDFFNGKNQWFSLYANDGHIDDKTFCDKQERNAFRLHPKGALGVSYGCIVIDNPLCFNKIAQMLRRGTPIEIMGANGPLTVWARVVVR